MALETPLTWSRVEALEAKVAELQRNSRTSSKPPSSDKGNFANPPKPKPKSLRRKSGKNQAAARPPRQHPVPVRYARSH